MHQTRTKVRRNSQVVYCDALNDSFCVSRLSGVGTLCYSAVSELQHWWLRRGWCAVYQACTKQAVYRVMMQPIGNTRIYGE